MDYGASKQFYLERIIVLADDDEDDQLFFCDVIKELNIDAQLLMFSDGEQLLQGVKNLDSKRIWAVFIDVNMPRVDGLQCVKLLRKNQQLSETPLYVMSTSLLPEQQKNICHEGANAYYQKPNSYTELKHLLSEVLIGSSEHT